MGVAGPGKRVTESDSSRWYRMCGGVESGDSSGGGSGDVRAVMMAVRSIR